MFEQLSTNPKPNLKQWLLVSFGLLLTFILLDLLIVTLLNKGYINHLLTPIFQYLSLFAILWEENAIGALQFILKKSLLAFTYQDEKSGLNVWTIEFDSITTFVYITACLITGRIVARYWFFQRTVSKRVLILSLLGCSFIVLSMSYMTSIEHCSGPTWVGFVSMYGMGFDEFQLYPAYQITVAITGIILLGLGFYRADTP